MTNHSNKPQTEAGAQVDAAKNQPQDAAQAPEDNVDIKDTEQPSVNYDEIISALQSQLTEHQDQLLRAKAEVENIRRRAQEDVSKARKFGIESFAESLIPVKDSLEAALAQPEQDNHSWQEGVETTLRQLTSSFERNALKEVAPNVGDLFDPHLHQAISSVPSDQPEGSVAQLLQKGYTIADRVLRPALVMVSAAKG